ncbi:hypothetical protein AYO38_05025 [bacterium SCGC AG-212-C10]|nr:hypothetical protein AYO38_05025 [bacterium SCGC AG-212-C10]
MRKAFRHTSVLMLFGVLALGLIGAAYTLWYEDLTLNATVTTGTFNADWSCHDWDTSGPTDNGTFDSASVGLNEPCDGAPVVALPPAGWGTLTSGVATLLGGGGNSTEASYPLFDYDNFYFNGVQKPLTTCSGLITSDNSAGQANDTGDVNVLTLTMGGLFPYAGCEFFIDVHNSGSVPFHIAVKSATIWQCPITNTAPNVPDACISLPEGPWSRGFSPFDADVNECKAWLGAEWPIAQLPKQANLPNGNPVQVHPGNDLECHFKLVLDQNPTAEGKKYFVQVKYATYQWNETPAIASIP